MTTAYEQARVPTLLHNQSQWLKVHLLFLCALMGTAILDLDHDVLWLIFSINTTFRDETSVSESHRTTVRSSHVCRAWRNILLDSSSIWGRLMVINDNIHQDWIEEIFRRSKSSPLCIQGNIPSGRIERLGYFSELIKNSWDRIEVFDLTLGEYDEQECKEIWSSMQQPSPLLKHFRLDSTDIHSLWHTLTEPLFGNYAPQIHEFSSYSLLLHNIPSWLSHIAVLVWCPNATPFMELPNILKEMPRLERLNLCYDDFVEENILASASDISINMPCLKNVFGYHSMTGFVGLWERIKISDTEDVYWCIASIDDDDNSPIEGLLQHASRAVSNLIAGHSVRYSSSAIRYLSLILNSTVFEFSMGGGLTLKFENIDRLDESSEVLSLFFGIFNSRHMEDISHLEIRVHEDLDDNVFLAFKSLLLSLSSVTTLDADIGFLKKLNELSLDASSDAEVGASEPDIFPHLNEVHVDTPGHSDCSSLDVEHLACFAVLRHEQGHAISTFSFSGHGFPEFQMLCDSIGDMEEIEITWRDDKRRKKFVYTNGRGVEEREV